jgi:signal transduction histidine kinase
MLFLALVCITLWSAQKVYRDSLEKRAFEQLRSLNSVIRESILKSDGVRVDRLREILRQRHGLGESGENYLVNEEGTFITDSRFIQETASLKLDTETFQATLKSGKPESAEQKDYRQINVYSVASTIQKDGKRFVLLSEIDVDEVMLPIRIPGRFIFIIICFIAFLGIAFAYKLSYDVKNYLIYSEREKIRSLLSGRDSERMRVAYDLHDSIGALANALRLQLTDRNHSGVSDHSEIHSTFSSFTEILRTISHDLVFPELEHYGIWKSLTVFFEDAAKAEPLHFEITIAPEIIQQRYLPDEERHLFYIAQGIYQNTVRHANAKNFSLQARPLAHDQLEIVFTDNGQGFPNRAEGFGLQSIRHRVEVLSGNLSIKTEKNDGTMIRIQVKINPRKS